MIVNQQGNGVKKLSCCGKAERKSLAKMNVLQNPVTNFHADRQYAARTLF
jgi:hypothetical protein